MDYLPDILPSPGKKLKMLIVGKTPTPESVSIGHFFQGLHGRRFWKLLQDYGILRVPRGKFDDELLLQHGFGITDMVRKPRRFNCQPSKGEYSEGFSRIQKIIDQFDPRILLFVYKKPLDKWLLWRWDHDQKACYGFNRNLEMIFKRKVFACPIAGIGPVTREMQNRGFKSLKRMIDQIKR